MGMIIILNIFIIYSVLSIVILTLLSISGLRLFNSLNMSMTLISSGGFLPTDSISTKEEVIQNVHINTPGSEEKIRKTLKKR